MSVCRVVFAFVFSPANTAHHGPGGPGGKAPWSLAPSAQPARAPLPRSFRRSPPGRHSLLRRSPPGRRSLLRSSRRAAAATMLHLTTLWFFGDFENAFTYLIPPLFMPTQHSAHHGPWGSRGRSPLVSHRRNIKPRRGDERKSKVKKKPNTKEATRRGDTRSIVSYRIAEWRSGLGSLQCGLFECVRVQTFRG